MKVATFCLAIALIAFCLSHAHAQTPSGQFNSRSFTYINKVLTATGPSSDSFQQWNGSNLPKFYSLSVTTAATGWTAALEGSLDNANWSTILITSTAIGITSNAMPVPALYLRLRAPIIGATTSITATAVGVW